MQQHEKDYQVLFNEDFLASLISDPIAGTLQICSMTMKSLSPGQGYRTQDYENLTEAYTLLSEMAVAEVLPIEWRFPSIDLSMPMGEKCAFISGTIAGI